MSVIWLLVFLPWGLPAARVNGRLDWPNVAWIVYGLMRRLVPSAILMACTVFVHFLFGISSIAFLVAMLVVGFLDAFVVRLVVLAKRKITMSESP